MELRITRLAQGAELRVELRVELRADLRVELRVWLRVELRVELRVWLRAELQAELRVMELRITRLAQGADLRAIQLRITHLAPKVELAEVRDWKVLLVDYTHHATDSKSRRPSSRRLRSAGPPRPRSEVARPCFWARVVDAVVVHSSHCAVAGRIGLPMTRLQAVEVEPRPHLQTAMPFAN